MGQRQLPPFVPWTLFVPSPTSLHRADVIESLLFPGSPFCCLISTIPAVVPISLGCEGCRTPSLGPAICHSFLYYDPWSQYPKVGCRTPGHGSPETQCFLLPCSRVMLGLNQYLDVSITNFMVGWMSLVGPGDREGGCCRLDRGDLRDPLLLLYPQVPFSTIYPTVTPLYVQLQEVKSNRRIQSLAHLGP